jgi:hypothetical protein
MRVLLTPVPPRAAAMEQTLFVPRSHTGGSRPAFGKKVSKKQAIPGQTH